MRIEGLRIEPNGQRVRAVARVLWEDCNRPARDVFYETEPEFADDLRANPDAYVVGALIPAAEFGEKRLRIEGRVCSRLHDNLQNVLALRRLWYGDEVGTIAIEPTGGFAASTARTPPRIASFLSGGIDSLATLRRNRLLYPAEHPASIRDCLTVYGFDLGGLEELSHQAAVFDRVVASNRRIADDTGATLIPVYTNVRHLEQSVPFWTDKYFASAMASVAHAFSHRLSGATIAASLWYTNLKPWGSHPLLDPCFGSAAVRIMEDGTRFERLEKVRIVADWPAALNNLRVCWNRQLPEGQINCGRCSKCVRTKLELMAVGKLDQAASMPDRDVTPDMIARIRIAGPGALKFFTALIEPLRRLDRHDLADALRARAERFHAEEEPAQKPARRRLWRAAISSILQVFRH